MGKDAWLLFAVLAILAAVAYKDAREKRIPNELIGMLALCGVLSALLFPQMGLLQRLLGAVVISAPMLAIAMMVPGAFGGGDIKLMAAAGVFLGWKLTVTAGGVGILLAGAYAVYLLVAGKRKRDTAFPLGPFLCAGIVCAMFAGDIIIRWVFNG